MHGVDVYALSIESLSRLITDATIELKRKQELATAEERIADEAQRYEEAATSEPPIIYDPDKESPVNSVGPGRVVQINETKWRNTSGAWLPFPSAGPQNFPQGWSQIGVPVDNTPPWKPNEDVEVDDLRSHGGKVYRVIQAHTTLVGWEPNNVPALWKLEEELSSRISGSHTSRQIGRHSLE